MDEQPKKTGRPKGSTATKLDAPGPAGRGTEKWYSSSKPNAKKVVELITKGVPASKAMLLSGYSASSAKRGISHLPKKYRDVLQKRTEQRIADLTKLSQQTSNEQMSHLVRGALTQNIADGQDRATASLKMAGGMRGVDLFTPENTLGIFVVECPKAFQAGGRLDPAAFARQDRQSEILHLEAKLRQREERLLELGEKDRGDCDWAERDKAELARLKAEEAQ